MDQYSVLAPFYDKLNGETDYTAIAAFLRRVFTENGIKKGSILLDLACGTGILTNLFAAEGYDMIGVDISPEMLFEAQEASYKLKDKRPLYLCQDMRKLDLYGTVEAAFSCLVSLNYLEEEGDLATVFSRLKHFIAPGGIFVFDLNTAYRFRHVYGQNTYVFDEDGVFCIWQNDYNEEEKTCDFDLTFFVKDGDAYYRSEESQRERLFEDDAVIDALEKNGFSLLATYGSPDFTPVTDKDEKRYFVVKRN